MGYDDRGKFTIGDKTALLSPRAHSSGELDNEICAIYGRAPLPPKGHWDQVLEIKAQINSAMLCMAIQNLVLFNRTYFQVNMQWMAAKDSIVNV